VKKLLFVCVISLAEIGVATTWGAQPVLAQQFIGGGYRSLSILR
jgi:hypothetical protein